jgi:hypothetical protein
MPTDVRVNIEYNEIVVSPVENEIGLIILWMIAEITEHTAACFRILRATGSDVLIAPGTPKPVQS